MMLVGEVIRPHGVRGELKVVSLMDTPQALTTLKTVAVGGIFFDVENARVNRDTVLLKLKNIDTMDDAETLRGKQIEIDRKDAPLLKEGRYYVTDLIGCKVVDCITKNIIGTLSNVLQYGAADVYEIKCLNSPNFSFPAIKSVIKDINLDEKIVAIDTEELSKVAVYEN